MKDQIASYLETRLPAYLALLRSWVQVNSFTRNAPGVNAVGDLTAAAFEPLGFSARRVPASHPEYGQHLVLSRPGQSGHRLGLISHLDTVFSAEEEQSHDFHWREDGNRIYGPGTNDVKGGTLMIYMVLEALQHFDPQTFNAVEWKILLNAAEETLSDDFGELCRQELQPNGLAALVFEAGKWNDQRFQLVTQRKGMVNYRIDVQGKAAHAGSSHSAGANAIVQLARLVDQVAALTDYGQELTFNAGVIRGGLVTNRVPHQATARGEMRTFELPVFEQGIQDLLALQSEVSVTSRDGYPCQVNIEITNRTLPWPANPRSEQLFQLWRQAGTELGFEIVREARGGLSDGNHLWQTLPTIDGLGPHGENSHCSERSPDGSKDQEFVARESFLPKALLNIRAIQALCQFPEQFLFIPNNAPSE
ncbi:MAG: M20/M25/M40 family metallo-hydrolase [Anaerolineales bacterium]|nr:M20/M25/M40 family metallo-hydrolase [Anaerolineales bacterium]